MKDCSESDPRKPCVPSERANAYLIDLILTDIEQDLEDGFDCTEDDDKEPERPPFDQ